MLTETKTKSSRRVIDLPEEIIAALKKHKRQILAEKHRAGVVYTDYDLVACTSTGNMLNPSNISRSFLRCIEAADVSISRSSTYAWVIVDCCGDKCQSSR